MKRKRLPRAIKNEGLSPEREKEIIDILLRYFKGQIEDAGLEGLLYPSKFSYIPKKKEK